MEIRTWNGDITTLSVDAIVNAANNSLMRGGGVCGAIFRAAGPGLDDACDAIGWCENGDAVATPSFALPCRWIIHTVGPVWMGGGEGEAEQLASCYRRVLEVRRWTSVRRRSAIPAISTGVYGYPAEQAASIAVSTLIGSAPGLVDEVVLVAFDDTTKARYDQLLATGRTAGE